MAGAGSSTRIAKVAVGTSDKLLTAFLQLEAMFETIPGSSCANIESAPGGAQQNAVPPPLHHTPPLISSKKAAVRSPTMIVQAQLSLLTYEE